MNFDEARARRTIFAIVWLALFLTATTGRSFTALYVFGDSLSDTGRSPAPPTSYYNGRYCNGPLWVEYLSTNLGLAYNPSNNYAVSGSTTSNLLSQIAGLPASTNLHSGLFTVWSGGNDFLDSTGLGTNDAGWNVVISNAVLNMTNALGTLYTNGAREIIVPNLPDLGKIPLLRSSPAGFTNYINSKVAIYNAALASGASNVMQRSPDLRIYLMDENAALDAILNSPATYGFTVITNGALEDPNLADKSFNGPGANYVFWDIIHPTTKVDVMTAATAMGLVGVQLYMAPSGANLSLTVSNLYPGETYTIQGSTNFTAWTNYQLFTAVSTNFTTTVTNGAGKKVFYRVGY